MHIGGVNHLLVSTLYIHGKMGELGVWVAFSKYLAYSRDLRKNGGVLVEVMSRGATRVFKTEEKLHIN